MSRGQQPNVDIANLKQWEGREQQLVDDLSPFKAHALFTALAREKNQMTPPGAGSILPPCWQWLYFLDTPSALETGTDGHPKTGGFLPPVPFPRRMWAAGKFEVLAPLTLGTPAEKSSRVSNVEFKEGSTGPLVFVTVKHRFMQDGQICIEEEQHIVYREMPTGPSPVPAGRPAPEDADWMIQVQPDPVLLFRFSALTYNAHRIHYDRQYAMEQEHYPALVVHSPLQAILLANSVQAQLENKSQDDKSSALTSLEFRAQRPLFDTDSFQVCGKAEEDKVRLWTRSHDGFIATSATVRLAPEP